MTWQIDGRIFARKVKNPTYGVAKGFETGHCTECPSCGYVIEQNNLAPIWPGLPSGVKFDPSDQELIKHLAAKVGLGCSESHPFIDEFIPTLDSEDGICYTHPENFPGIRHDGSNFHFFHRPSKAYAKGTRKRRKVQSAAAEDGCEVRWHKTGKTRPVLENENQVGCKKIMVLYVYSGKKVKPVKTNWVMHQYHLGVHEEENDGDLVVSKVFYQTQPRLVGSKDNADQYSVPADMEVEKHKTHHSLSHVSNSIWKADGTEMRGCQFGNNQLIVNACSQVTYSAPNSKAIEQRKSLLATLTEDAHRLKASLSTHSWNMEKNTALEPGATSEIVEWDTSEIVEWDNSCFDPKTNSMEERDACTDQVSVDNDGMPKNNCHEPITGVVEANSGNKSAHKFDSLENIILDTPPEFLLESLMSSQETSNWLEKIKFCSDSSQKSSGSEELNILDYLKGSQSSI